MIYVDDLQLRAGDLITMSSDPSGVSGITVPFWPLLIINIGLVYGVDDLGWPASKTYQIKLLDQWGGIAHSYIDHKELHECVTLISRNK